MRFIDGNKFVENISVEVVNTFKESEDAFIFESVLPFCSKATSKVILKDDLIKALQLYFDQGSAYNNGYLEGYKDGSKAVRTQILESIEKRWGKNE